MSKQIAIGENVARAIVSENMMKGKVCIEKKAKNVYINRNLGTEQVE